MSNTYRDKMHAKFHRAEYDSDEWHEALAEFYKHYSWNFYCNCPKQWNKYHHIRPYRRHEKHILNKVDLNNMGEDAQFNPMHKPHHYYW